MQTYALTFGGEIMIIKMGSDKSLLITIPTTIYRGESNADLITFLVPMEYENQLISDCEVVLNYILPDEKEGSEALHHELEPYKNYLQYTTMADAGFTLIDGDVTMWIVFTDADKNVVLKTGEVYVTVSPSHGDVSGAPGCDCTGNGGVVYVPHIDDRKVLSFTVEEMAGEIPAPVDLNPFDEWYPVDPSEGDSQYVWEPM